jgi:hypothetical protein
LDYDRLDKVCLLFILLLSSHAYGNPFEQFDRHGNTQLAFEIAAEHLGIPVSNIFHVSCVLFSAIYHTAITRG